MTRPLPCPTVLTHREADVVAGLAGSQTIKGIAFDLRLSPKTVEYHKARACRKLRIFDIAGLTRYAMRWGLVSLFMACTAFAASVQLAWDPSPDSVTGYTVCYGPSDNLTVLSNLAVGNVLVCTVSNLAIGQRYDFYVKARSPAGDSVPSNTVAEKPWLVVTCYIEESDDLVRWAPLTNTTVNVKTQSPSKFYRARMEEQ